MFIKRTKKVVPTFHYGVQPYKPSGVGETQLARNTRIWNSKIKNLHAKAFMAARDRYLAAGYAWGSWINIYHGAINFRDDCA